MKISFKTKMFELRLTGDDVGQESLLEELMFVGTLKERENGNRPKWMREHHE